MNKVIQRDLDIVGSQKRLADICGVSQPAVHKWLNGGSVSPETRKDLTRIAAQVDPHIKVQTTETQRAAIYSFAYNVGATATINSTLLKKLNAKDYAGACSELKRWVYAGGKKWKGLMNRRDVEYEVCSWSQK